MKVKFERITTADAENIKKFNKENLVSALRVLRESECFETVNRGQVWYELLTDEQKAELKDWYQAWLDVTETAVVPNKPKWLR
jgi:hypothetical protein